METKKKILVVDDEEDLCFFLKEELEVTGKYTVVTTTDATKAESLAKLEKPAMILLDIVMPNKKGSEIATDLKKDPETKQIPIVILSGLGEMVYFKKKEKWQWIPNSEIVQQRGDVVHEKSASKAAEMYGVDDYIEKPFTFELLQQVMDDVFERTKAKKAKQEDQEPQ